ncbi:MAG TPA: hypothetical protein VFK84_07465, partial [Burkholderiales bacterium]|nr:hypothetical protein [Burkholderiales bacterium]
AKRSSNSTDGKQYGEPHRAYHTQHLEECFALFDQTSPQHPGEVLLALWFHDARQCRKIACPCD